jgi:hypothetical protein
MSMDKRASLPCSTNKNKEDESLITNANSIIQKNSNYEVELSESFKHHSSLDEINDQKRHRLLVGLSAFCLLFCLAAIAIAIFTFKNILMADSDERRSTIFLDEKKHTTYSKYLFTETSFINTTIQPSPKQENKQGFITFEEACSKCLPESGLKCSDDGQCECSNNKNNSLWSNEFGKCLNCPQGWRLLDEKCYYLSLTLSVSWDDAQSDCQTMIPNSNLMTLGNEAEFKRLVDFSRLYKATFWVCVN